jgi:hypothetical protein
MESRLKFTLQPKDRIDTYSVTNLKGQLLGEVKKMRTGRFMHFCFVVPLYLIKEMAMDNEELSMSPGCQDEIREFCKKLNGYKKTPKQNKIVKTKNGGHVRRRTTRRRITRK